MTEPHPIDCVEGPVAASLGVPLLRISGLRTYFRTRETLVKAVDGVDVAVKVAVTGRDGHNDQKSNEIVEAYLKRNKGLS